MALSPTANVLITGRLDADVKIFINALSARLGGGQTYLKNILAHLPDWPDLEVHIFSPASLALPSESRIVRRATRWPTENPVLRTFWEIAVLPKLLARERADVLFCPGGVVATRAPRGCRTVTMFRNMIPFDRSTGLRIPIGLQRIRNFMLRRAMLRSMSRADRTIFVSEHARSMIEALSAIPDAITIPHGISNAFRTAAHELPRPNWVPAGRYMLYVSRFDVYKHQREVVEGFLLLPKELRRGLTLVLAGEATEKDLGNLSRLIQRETDCKVVALGAVAYSDLPGAYHHAVANIFASSCENCPNILLEALGAGRPLLSSQVPPMPEFAGDAAVYFDPFNPETICTAMRRVLENADLAERLGEKAAERSRHYDWKVSAERTWQCLIDLATK